MNQFVSIFKSEPNFEPEDYKICSASLQIARLKEADSGLYYCKNGKSLRQFSVIALSKFFFAICYIVFLCSNIKI